MLRRLLSDNALLGLQYAAASLVPLLLVPHFVRTLGAANFGVIAMLIAGLGLASVFVQYAFALTGPADLAQRNADAESQRRILLDSLVARMVLLAVVMPGGLVLVLLLPANLRLTAAVLLALPMAAAMNTGWFLQATQRVHVLALLGSLAAAASLSIGFLLVRDENAQPWAALALAAGPLVLGVGTLLWSLATLPVGAAGASLATAKRTLVRGWPLFSSQFISALYAQLGPLVVGAISGVAAAGLYGAIERIANALQAALGLTHTAAYPQLARLFGSTMSDRARYLRLVRVVLALHWFGVATLGIALFAFSAEVQQFIFGQSTSTTTALLWVAYGWIALSVFGPLLTGYWTVSGQGTRVLPLTLRVLLVSLIVGAASTWAVGAAGWLVGLISGQMLVFFAAFRAHLTFTKS